MYYVWHVWHSNIRALLTNLRAFPASLLLLLLLLLFLLLYWLVLLLIISVIFIILVIIIGITIVIIILIIIAIIVILIIFVKCVAKYHSCCNPKNPLYVKMHDLHQVFTIYQTL